MNRAGRVSIPWVFLAAGLLALGAWWGCGQGGRTEAAVPRTARVVRRDFATTVMATGAVKPMVGAEVRVGARISGKVERLLANVGAMVRRGEVIAQLEKADLEAAVAECEAEKSLAEAKLASVSTLGPREVDKAAAEVAACKATLALARKELKRQESLLKQDFTSQQTRDRAHERVTVAEAQLVSAGKSHDLARARVEDDTRQARAVLDRARAALDLARVRLSYATITAPISGVVASVSTQEGETVAAGLNAPTFVTIIDLDRLQVDAFVDEVDIGKVATGQKTTFTVEAFPAKEFEGRVAAIYPKAILQENVVNYDVVVEIASRAEACLRPEMTASVTIHLAERTGVLAVPVRAVKQRRGKPAVYTLEDGTPRLHPVKVGWRDGEWVEVIEGLREGQEVLLESPPSEDRG